MEIKNEQDNVAKIEQSVIGCIFTSPDFAMEQLAEHCPLVPEDFYFQQHTAAFRAILSMMAEGRRPTPLLISAAVGDEKIGGVSGNAYWARTVTVATTLAGIVDHALTLKEYVARRNLLAAATEIATDVAKPHEDIKAKEIAEKAEVAIFSARGGEAGSRFIEFGEAIQQAVRAAAAAHDRGDGLAGISTGLRDLDRKIGGLMDTNVIVLGGRPGMGKSALAFDICYSVSEEGGATAFFSLEMSAEQLAMRRLARETGISSARLKRGQFSKDEFDTVADAAKRLQSIPLFIEETGGISLSSLITKARRLHRKHGLKLIVIDYLQLMTVVTKRGGDNRTNDLTAITTGLKALAKELGIPILLLSQLSRGLEARPDKRPHLADLRESGSIEQDADVVMFVYRDEYYLASNVPPAGTPEMFEWEAKMEHAHGRAEIIIGKQRHGPLGSVDVKFNAELTAFSDWNEQYEAPF